MSRPNFLPSPGMWLRRRSGFAEAVDTLGDTANGAFDELDMLEHPAAIEAARDTEIGAWGWLAVACVAVAVCALSAIWPGPWFGGAL